MDMQYINMIWLIRKLRHKLIMMQEYKYASYLLNLEKRLTKKKSNYQGFPNTLK